MTRCDPSHHHRRSMRLKAYDYAQAGAYFVTICARHRELLFDPEPVRAMIRGWWDKLPEEFPNVGTDAFVIMPNHIHGIIVLVEAESRVGPTPRVGDVGADPRVGPTPRVGDVGADPRVGPNPRVRPDAGRRTSQGADTGAPLPTVIQWFKTMTTNEYIRGVKESGWAPFPAKLWQRNYYEHIIRSERELNAIREYIDDNPLKWELDWDNPANQRQQPLPESAADYSKDAGIS